MDVSSVEFNEVQSEKRAYRGGTGPVPTWSATGSDAYIWKINRLGQDHGSQSRLILLARDYLSAARTVLPVSGGRAGKVCLCWVLHLHRWYCTLVEMFRLVVDCDMIKLPLRCSKFGGIDQRFHNPWLQAPPRLREDFHTGNSLYPP